MKEEMEPRRQASVNKGPSILALNQKSFIIIF